MSADPQIVQLEEAPSEVDQLAAEGIEVELAGAPFRLRFDFSALRHVERTFRSLNAFSDMVIAGRDGEFIGMLEGGLTACLLHAGMPRIVLEQVVEDALSPPLDWDLLDRYHQAILDACIQAGLLRRKKSPPADGEAAAATDAATTSPGSAGTTSRRSGTTARTRRSGG